MADSFTQYQASILRKKGMDTWVFDNLIYAATPDRRHVFYVAIRDPSTEYDVYAPIKTAIDKFRESLLGTVHF
jgi:hypothetical protein